VERGALRDMLKPLSYSLYLKGETIFASGG
jgi:hypothetical protein